jgi:uncharacterized membrane protein/thiol-disulfide isomerase/thioredoxin
MKYSLWAVRLILVFALAVCGATLGESLFHGTMCDFHSGCDSVLNAPFARPWGVPLLPIIGLVGFSLLFVLTLFPGREAFVFVGPLAVGAGLFGLALILVQVLVLGKTCELCLLVDGSAIVLALVALAGGLGWAKLPPLSWLGRSAWLSGAVLATLLPPLLSWGWAPPPVPEQVKARWVEGKITVVDLVDFECTACRTAEPELEAFREKMGDKIHFIRLPAPMRSHQHSRDAARAYLAAEKQGKGDRMAQALFAAISRDEAECRKMAQHLGLNVDQYDRVVKDPATDAQLDEIHAWAEATGKGLPLVWVRDQMISGIPNRESLQSAYRRAVLSAAAPRQ